ncbi:uncharacterized protein si:ch211-189a15.5 isoform X1 [Seriola aureovittata]|uniref:uncharacterized protein si:ch211-189a15.5 isoform X1 n=1 Tax=Seriola aureovittata TaxID=2871759 RepID=UPI0024BEEDDA|nr:uncharacterized protein si:ch211-189a15.5 isoform X1 [Seriola aureovittata]
MKDGSGAAEQAEVSRQELYEDYVKCYRQPCPEARPCRDERLLKKAAQYLLREPESGGIFTVFPFYQAVAEDHEALSTDCRRHLSAFIKATELLETLCVNLFLQPWKKEFKTLKTFTGPFVYRLLPVLSSFTIQSVLASIGYLPNTDAPHSEFRLSEDADPDRAILLGFELLLARVECSNLLEQPVTDQQGPQPQEWLDLLQRRGGPSKPEAPTATKTTTERREEERKKEEADKKEVPLYSDTRIAVKPQPKPRHIHLISADQSIIEMQRTYPDLAFRGRLLLPDKPHPANGSRSSSKAVLAVGHHYSDDSKDAELSKRDARAAATAVCSNSDGSKAGEVLGDSVRSSGCSDRNSGGTSTPANPASSSFINTDDDEFSGPQAISLHITLRAGAKAEQDQRPGESQPTAGPQQAAAGEHNKRPTQPEPSSLTTEDDEEDLRGLAERMGQLRVQEHKQKELRRRGENRRREDSTNKERRKKDRKVSTEGEAEEQKLRKPVMETGPALNHEASRCSGSSQPDPAAMKEQKQSTVTDCESCEGGGSTGQQEGGDPGPEEEEEEEEEEPPQSFVIV